MYAVYHGAEGLRAIASGVHRRATSLARRLDGRGVSTLVHREFFDTLLAAGAGPGGRRWWRGRPTGVCSCGWSTTTTWVSRAARPRPTATWRPCWMPSVVSSGRTWLQSPRLRRPCRPRCSGKGPILNHPVFSEHHSETAMLRYLRSLSDRDFALDRGMIPLGSCTMKLNATTEMEPVSLPGFANIHPFAPAETTPGYLALIDDLEGWLAELTGYAKVSVQPNAGSQGELAGLLAIRSYHQAQGHPERDVCLIPSSAHGTNAASAVMVGMRVVVVASLGRRHGRPGRPGGQVR